MFLSFDGIDGAGKSTQMDLLCDWLENTKGKQVVRCREPGGTSLGEVIREILLNRRDVQLNIEAELFLFMASRAQLVREVIRPALARHQIVVCDRFLMASIVYQGHAGGLDPEQIRRVGELAVDGTYPDLTFVFRLDPRIAAERVGHQTDRIESRQESFLRKVDEGFGREVDLGNLPAVSIDATLSVDEIQQQIRQRLAPLL